MKIAFIGQKGIPAKSGGVEKHVEEIAARLAQKGHGVFVYVRNNYTPKNLNVYRGIKLIHLPSIPTKHLDAISHTFLATIHALFQNYDVLHYQAIGPSSLSIIPKIFKRKTAIIATYHCQDYFHKKWNWFARTCLKFGEIVTSVFPDKTIAVSKILGDYILAKFKKQAVVIPNGMNVFPTEESQYLAKWNLQKGSYILSVGRLIRHKGVHYLIEAFKNLEDKHLTRGKKLVIVGDGFYTDEYVKEIKDASRGRENIIFTGSQTNEALNQLFSHSYCFVQPSESEGLSLALLEAMGYGKAILSSDIKENMQALNAEVSISFRSGDARDLEEKLIFLINNPALVKNMGEKAMEKAWSQFSWDKIVDQVEAVYEEVLNKKRS
ncbi:MAG: Glycosyl transferase group 1 [Candidatus Moranbacteria bacterium GW2011_GWF2_36_839]|nr:MAG: Glycosyl transferase group 1 [Candidatus Moranbacteria bacterium GW2011_GWF1_36_78]KKQ17758.1 MAG: Glycosyl transferase group 1 [Candidatus Moranbacteria bacterium GW2011_GWF2_36_839]HAT73459.1 glycosyl transferase family 1 [Candidatus Moranbacteria bacterium]HBY10821.1 glycosyl transferase family 1 [Candidatus Moranbacteria bacterium]